MQSLLGCRRCVAHFRESPACGAGCSSSPVQSSCAAGTVWRACRTALSAALAGTASPYDFCSPCSAAGTVWRASRTALSAALTSRAGSLMRRCKVGSLFCLFCAARHRCNAPHSLQPHFLWPAPTRSCKVRTLLCLVLSQGAWNVVCLCMASFLALIFPVSLQHSQT